MGVKPNFDEKLITYNKINLLNNWEWNIKLSQKSLGLIIFSWIL